MQTKKFFILKKNIRLDMTDGVNFSVGDIGALDRDDAVVLYRQGRMKYGG